MLHLNKNMSFFNNESLSRLSKNTCLLYGKLSSAPEKKYRGFGFTVSCDSITSEIGSHIFSGKKIICFADSLNEELVTGYRIICGGRYVKPEKPLNPYGFDEQKHSILLGVWGKFEADSIKVINRSTGFHEKIYRFVNIKLEEIISHFPRESHRGIIKAMVSGNKTSLYSYTGKIFKNAGIYHVLAISGLHVGIITLSLITLFSVLMLPRVLKYSLVILILWLYLFFVGLVPSLFRSVIMATFLLSSFFIERQSSSLNSLGIAGIIWLFIFPDSLFSPGFQLSFSATAGIIILLPVFRSFFLNSTGSDKTGNILNPVLTSLSVSFSAFLSTAPVLLYHFGTLSLTGLFVNVFAVFIIWIIMNLFFLCSVLFFILKPAAFFFIAVITMLFDLIINIAEFSGYFPQTVIKTGVPSFYYITACALFLTGLATVKKKLRLQYLCWSIVIMSILTPLVITADTYKTKGRLCKLSLEKGWMNIISFPGNKIWIIGNVSHKKASAVCSGVIEPWIHNNRGSKLEALILDSCGNNIIHKLEPFMKSNLPEILVLPRLPVDKLTRRNLKDYLNEHSTRLVVPETGDIFIPCESCTCSVVKKDKKREYQIKTGNDTCVITSDYTLLQSNSLMYLNKKNNGVKRVIVKTRSEFCVPEINLPGIKQTYEILSVQQDGAVFTEIFSRQ